uniref:Uncharacterized protein n=1 Tax=Nymphaea colorata TaxID=210225 RepID=A0A5K1FCC4_9MAGN|nr:unnamed protein product [Nymphaea colorata]
MFELQRKREKSVVIMCL